MPKVQWNYKREVPKRGRGGEDSDREGFLYDRIFELTQKKQEFAGKKKRVEDILGRENNICKGKNIKQYSLGPLPHDSVKKQMAHLKG